ncbi:hypothetical protein [Roseateles sp. BYS87W]|uniref:Uncharacterized protein n=1 Tax=Pelomonas baiyunensis TaxID=3299026 RepID=A0ABW7H011_9BURK
MKAFALTVAVAALVAVAPSDAAREATPKAAQPSAGTVVALADAGRLGTASLTSLNNTTPQWTSGGRPAEFDFDSFTGQVDTGTVVIALGVLALVLARPVSRALRRQEQHRRATALASTLGHAPRA